MRKLWTCFGPGIMGLGWELSCPLLYFTRLQTIWTWLLRLREGGHFILRDGDPFYCNLAQTRKNTHTDTGMSPSTPPTIVCGLENCHSVFKKFCPPFEASSLPPPPSPPPPVSTNAPAPPSPRPPTALSVTFLPPTGEETDVRSDQPALSRDDRGSLPLTPLLLSSLATINPPPAARTPVAGPGVAALQRCPPCLPPFAAGDLRRPSWGPPTGGGREGGSGGRRMRTAPKRGIHVQGAWENRTAGETSLGNQGALKMEISGLPPSFTCVNRLGTKLLLETYKVSLHTRSHHSRTC